MNGVVLIVGWVALLGIGVPILLACCFWAWDKAISMSIAAARLTDVAWKFLKHRRDFMAWIKDKEAKP